MFVDKAVLPLMRRRQEGTMDLKLIPGIIAGGRWHGRLRPGQPYQMPSFTKGALNG
jgi:hypothetical protein